MLVPLVYFWLYKSPNVAKPFNEFVVILLLNFWLGDMSYLLWLSYIQDRDNTTGLALVLFGALQLLAFAGVCFFART